MAMFSLQEIIDATKGYAINCDNIEFVDVITDTRKLVKNALFIALKGECFDGHDFVVQAIKSGAAAVIVEHEIPGGYPQIIVKNTLKALQDIARFHRRRFAIPVIAITGSSGKTTTKELIGTVLDSKFNVLKTHKNYNNEIGVPLTLLQLSEEHEACVIEMGMRGLGQIAELAAIAEPTIGVVTNVGTSHIELLGSQEGIAKAKSELVKAIGKDGYIVLNEDDVFVRDMANNSDAKVMTYGLKQGAITTGFNIRYKSDGIKFDCRCYDEVFSVFLPMIGIHNVYDALAAIAVGRILGISVNKMAKSLGDFPGIPLRQEIINFGDFVLVNDTYNANPSSMEQSIKAIGQLQGKRKVAILADMLELGTYSEEKHLQIGELLGKENYKMVLLYGKESQFIGQGAKATGVEIVKHFDTHEEIVEFYYKNKEKGDTILLKGSRGMTMEKVAEGLKKVVQ